MIRLRNQYFVSLCKLPALNLILRKTIKNLAAKCHILRLKCTIFDLGWGSALDHNEGDHSALPNLLAGFDGSNF